MQTTITFEKQWMRVSKWNEGATVPFISGISILQNSLESQLAPDDKANIGYGKVATIYPYTEQNVYTRQLQETEVEVVKLENDFICALFIPSLGGRLWSLYDKVAKKELLYVNDVIRPSNLAVRNAWVSGGVEWNIGVIGHSPFTCEQLFVGQLEVDGMPVLRMYEYERIRKVTYQMDFFLPEDSRYLMCRMRIVNPNKEVVPMYWWSNIAVNEQEKGRLVVEAESAYTNADNVVYKVEVPKVNGIDITNPKEIPISVDYFFDIDENKRKYITYLNEEGYGLIQTSTSRLEGRKLFVWGQTRGSQRWQQYLNEQAGPYIEIQAGLAKTQYGCLPMPEESEWEWIEAYGPMQVDKEAVQGDWYQLRELVTRELESRLPAEMLEKCLSETRESIALKPAQVIKEGGIFGAVENRRRESKGLTPLSSHLDFGHIPVDNQWIKLLKEGTIGAWPEVPGSYMIDDTYYELLQDVVQNKDLLNGYAWYHLGLNHLVRQKIDEAIDCFKESLRLEANAFNSHALAVAWNLKGDQAQTVTYSLKAILRRQDDIGLVKSCMSLLVQNEAYTELIEVSEYLPEEVKHNTRISLYRAYAYAQCKNVNKARRLIYKNSYIEVDDIREGELFAAVVWDRIQALEEVPQELPFELDFNALFV
ncbi:DUF5107 domain-containing protein [Niameybacter massiliensis]|uniref:DUF5107 domain-containing protein n=1 Tax=Holtiella tumoricola TaxID=3018743 RepID=A0AA42DKF0_9FIRM|nr:DUF5107 domain-containing protein [Holtiella tumoricola]MDA3730686.1 DUF5107 domain-containing protein [Holtiella tumoricola]